MPRKVRLHSDGKSKISKVKLQKATSHAPGARTDDDTADADKQFQLELCWCIQKLETALADKNLDDKQKNESWKVLQILKNNSQALIRKRQLMRTHFGDYREKMRQEEKKHASKAKQQVKFIESPSTSVSTSKSVYLRKSLFRSAGEDAFKFNFQHNLNLDETETNKSPNSTDMKKDSQKIAEEVNISPDPPFKFNFTNTDFRFHFNVDDDGLS